MDLPPAKVIVELAAHLDGARAVLTSQWRDAVRGASDIPASRRLSESQLVDHLPAVFADLVTYLRLSGDDTTRNEVGRTGSEHGHNRWQQSFRLEELLREVAVLHRTVVDGAVKPFLRSSRLTEEAGEMVRTLVDRFFEDLAVSSTGRFVADVNQRLERSTRELERANARLATADENRLRLLRAVTHELGNALNALTLGLGVLGLADNNAERERVLSLCHRNLGDMEAMLGDLRDYGTLFAGEAHPEIGPVVVAELAIQLVDGHRLLVQAEDLDLRVRVDPNLSTVRTDARRLRQIVSNLISNAVKYRDPVKRPGWVELSLERAGPDRWRVAVSDNGLGIARENLSTIFQEFRRVNPDGAAHGTGLGLAIVKGLTQLLGGEVHVESEPGQGSRFAMEFPTELPTPDPPRDGSA